MTRAHGARLLLGILLSAAFVVLVVRQIDLAQLRRALAGTAPAWVGAALLALAAGYACRIERWCLMLRVDRPALRWGQCAGPLLGSFAANNVLPLRAGDALRVFAFNARLGVGPASVLATLFVERLLDLLMVLLMLGAALAAFGLDAGAFIGLGTAASVALALAALALAILLLLLYPQLLAPLARYLAALGARLAPRLGARLPAQIDQALAILGHLAVGTTMRRLVGFSLAAWLAEGCVFWSCARALDALRAPAAAWLALPVGTLATLIPGAPGYLGTFDYFTIRAMSALGNAAAAATAFALLVHVLLWLPVTALGALYLALYPAKKPPAADGAAR